MDRYSSDGIRAAAQGVGEQFATKIVDEIILPLFAQIVPQAGRSRRLRLPPGNVACVSTGRPPSLRARVRRSGRSPRRPGRTNRSGRGSRHSFVGAMAGQQFAQRQFELRFILGQFGHHRRRRRNLLAEHVLRRPSCRASRGWCAGRENFGEKYGHRQQAAAAIWLGVVDRGTRVGAGATAQGEFRHSIMLRQHRIDERIVAVQKSSTERFAERHRRKSASAPRTSPGAIRS